MRLSSMKFELSDKDLMSIVKDYVKVDGLSIDKIEVNELIDIEGSYKKKVTIPFKATVGIGNVQDNIVAIKIFKVKVAKVGILNKVKDALMSKFLKEFEEYGIKIEKDNIYADLNTLSKVIPYVYFNVKRISVEKDIVVADVDNIIYAQDKETLVFKKKQETKKSGNCYDKYREIREDVTRKVPEKYKKLLEYGLIIPDIMVLFYRLFRDKRVNIKTKIMVGAIIAYLASPIDLILDFIPVIGQIDDIAIVFYGLSKIIEDVPEEVILDNWEGKQNIIVMAQEAVKYISTIVGSRNVDKVVGFFKNVYVKSKKEEAI